MNTKLFWIGGRLVLLYKMKYPAKERRSFLGIKYTKTVTRAMWVDRETKYPPVYCGWPHRRTTPAIKIPDRRDRK